MAVKIKHGQALQMLSLTALIDCVFNLLIFFLVATKFAEDDKERDMKVKLPSASMARPMTHKPQDIFVNIDDAGRILVGGQQLTLRQLESHLAQAKTDNPLGQNVKIRADKRASVQAAVDVFNACNKAGIESYSVTTDATPNST